MIEQGVSYGKGGDIDEIIDLMNYVFSQSAGPHDFKRLIPKLYKGRDSSAFHYTARKKGRLIAVLCCQPMDYDVMGRPIRACAIGGVAVHPYERGKGHMGELMQNALADMDCAFSVLAGQRQRYARFGYYPSGFMIEAVVTRENIRHVLGGQAPVEAKELWPGDLSALKAAYGLHSSKPIKCLRAYEMFYDILNTWGSRPFAFYSGGCFAGYASVAGETVHEFELCDQSLGVAAAAALIRSLDVKKLLFSFPLYDYPKGILDMCESFAYTTCHSYNIFDYAALIEAYLSARAKDSGLAGGLYALNINGDTYSISVSGGRCAVEKRGEDAPAVKNAAALFSPEAYMRGELQAQPLKSWLPIPLFAPSLDVC